MDEWFAIIGRIVVAVLAVGIIWVFFNTNLGTFLQTEWTTLLH